MFTITHTSNETILQELKLERRRGSGRGLIQVLKQFTKEEPRESSFSRVLGHRTSPGSNLSRRRHTVPVGTSSDLPGRWRSQTFDLQVGKTHLMTYPQKVNILYVCYSPYPIVKLQTTHPFPTNLPIYLSDSVEYRRP